MVGNRHWLVAISRYRYAVFVSCWLDFLAAPLLSTARKLLAPLLHSHTTVHQLQISHTSLLVTKSCTRLMIRVVEPSSEEGLWKFTVVPPFSSPAFASKLFRYVDADERSILKQIWPSSVILIAVIRRQLFWNEVVVKGCWSERNPSLQPGCTVSVGAG